MKTLMVLLNAAREHELRRHGGLPLAGGTVHIKMRQSVGHEKLAGDVASVMRSPAARQALVKKFDGVLSPLTGGTLATKLVRGAFVTDTSSNRRCQSAACDHALNTRSRSPWCTRRVVGKVRGGRRKQSAGQPSSDVGRRRRGGGALGIFWRAPADGEW